jgi:translation initiation factor 1A
MSDGDSDLRLPDDDEVLGIVESMLGANRLEVRCMDGETRTARIPGRMKKRVWINEGDVVIIEPWDWQDEKADVNWRYDSQQADQLRREGYL